MNHYFTGNGVLCGTRCFRNWTLVEAAVTCPACIACLQANPRERRARAGDPRTAAGAAPPSVGA